VGSAEEVAKSLLKYQGLGITHFVLSDTPYLPEIKRQGDHLLPLLRVEPATAPRAGSFRTGSFRTAHS
jgi:alkanesulfonate monooxygenase SsuD/methylene tetrahydromethanopterin reductase-like flavin-dependent oxidoreductase (luciferase family)